jgi:hypothetical protein
MSMWIYVGIAACIIVVIALAFLWNKKRQNDRIDLSRNGRCPNCRAILRDEVMWGFGNRQHHGGSHYSEAYGSSLRVFCTKCGYEK